MRTILPAVWMRRRQIGKPVSGIMREAGINWTMGRERGGPDIG